jgi:hypothetical protein
LDAAASNLAADVIRGLLPRVANRESSGWDGRMKIWKLSSVDPIAPVWSKDVTDPSCGYAAASPSMILRCVQKL